MEGTTSKIKINWEEISSLVDKLALQISSSEYEFKSIYGVPRGGLIPAVMLSHKLNIPISMGSIYEDTLIVDDICDSGVTFDEIYSRYQTEFAFSLNLKFASLHYRKHTSNFIPTFYGNLIPNDDWIIYPWEDEKADAIQDYLKDQDVLDFLEQVDKPGPWSEEDSKLHTVGGLTNDKEGSFMKFQNKIK